MRISKATPCMRFPVGAEVQEEGGTHFRVWAPLARTASVVFENSPRSLPLTDERDGYFSGCCDEAPAGTRYKIQLDGGEAYPDPASRFQPLGPHGYSEV